MNTSILKTLVENDALVRGLESLSGTKPINPRLLDEGTISQGSWLDFYPTLQALYQGGREALGIAPSERLMGRLNALRSPVLKPQTPFEWADWTAGTAAEGLQTGLAAADLAGLAGVVGPAAGKRLLNVLADQSGQVDNIFKNLTGEERFERMTPRQKKMHEMQISHEDEMFLDKWPTWGFTDEKVKNIASKIRRDAIEKYNKYKSEFEKTGVIDTGYHDLFGGVPNKKDSEKLLSDSKKEMEQAIYEAEQYIEKHKEIKELFFKNGKWKHDIINKE